MNIFKPSILESDIKIISDILRSGNLGFGSNVSMFESKFSNFSNYSYNISTNSASAASFMIFAYLKELYGACDVYTPSLGFVSPTWAAKHHGHNIIWVDVNENLLFDINDYKNKRLLSNSKRKSIVMPILYGGVSNIKGFDNIKEEYDHIVVVDSAHCVTPTIKSDYIFFSFHPYKPIAASDGGMISTNDEAASYWFKSYKNFGRQNINKTYDITMDGFKFYMNNLNASIALTQLNCYDDNLKIRKRNHLLIENLNLDGRLLPHDSKSSYYFTTLICNKRSVNDLCEKYQTPKHYPMLHKTQYFENGTELPFTEEIHKLILNLPLYDRI